MKKVYDTGIDGILAITDKLHEDRSLLDNKLVYKFIWVKSGKITMHIDYQDVELEEGGIISLTNLQHIEFKNIKGEYYSVLFNGNFYCIYENDHEVSCSGFIFNGSSQLITFMLDKEENEEIEDIIESFNKEFEIKDKLQEEMLRITLKRLIINTTRIAHKKLGVTIDKEKSFEVVRQFYILLDKHYKEKKRVKDYADMLHKSPKTLSNIFSVCKLPSPLKIIHERIESEAKRLLLYSNKNINEIAEILGFEDSGSFSRFFKNNTGISPFIYKNTVI